MAIDESILRDLEARKEKARQQGGPEKVARQHQRGRLTARERIHRLLDPDTFSEVGLLATSDMPGMANKTPADGLITGFGKINGRPVAVVANDFTVLASTNARIYSKKAHHMRDRSHKLGIPLIWLGESGGGRVPDIQGYRIASLCPGDERSIFSQYSRIRQTPWILAVMGQCNGVPMWQACLSDLVIQVKGCTLSVSGSRALRRSIGATYNDEEMGGWQVHAEITGIVDRVVEDEEECFQVIKDYLDYMPSHIEELPPYRPAQSQTQAPQEAILEVLPAQRTRPYDMYRIIRILVDRGEIFDIKPLFGKTIITCLARIEGHVVGFIANQPMEKGGAMDTQALDKMTSFMVLCDSFNIPIIFIHDTPGFLVGKEAERRKVGAKVTNALHALAQVTVPKISIIVRKSYGQAMFSLCGPSAGPDFIVAWPTAEVGFLAPETAVDVAYGALAPEERRKLVDKMIQDSSPYPLAQEFYLHDIIDPRETRDYLAEVLGRVRNSKHRGIGQHRLINWPTKF